MPEADPTKIMTFKTPKDLERWFETNHSSETELWIKIFKKKTKIASVTWDEVVIESLCWGWIDGVKKSIDEKAYLQRITPRKAQSNWSKRNRDHVERLIREGRMQESGLVHVRAAKVDGRWEKSYVASEMDYNTNYTKKQLEFICDYYGISKRKKKKQDLVEEIVIFEKELSNFDIVQRRKTMWFYIEEISNDSFLSKFLILD